MQKNLNCKSTVTLDLEPENVLKLFSYIPESAKSTCSHLFSIKHIVLQNIHLLVQRSFLLSLKIQLAIYLASHTDQTALFNMCCTSISTLQVLWNFNQKCSHVTVRYVFFLLPSYCSTWVWTMIGGGKYTWLSVLYRISDTGNLPIRIKNSIYWNSYLLFQSSIQASLQKTENALG